MMNHREGTFPPPSERVRFALWGGLGREPPCCATAPAPPRPAPPAVQPQPGGVPRRRPRWLRAGGNGLRAVRDGPRPGGQPGDLPCPRPPLPPSPVRLDAGRVSAGRVRVLFGVDVTGNPPPGVGALGGAGDVPHHIWGGQTLFFLANLNFCHF